MLHSFLFSHAFTVAWTAGAMVLLAWPVCRAHLRLKEGRARREHEAVRTATLALERLRARRGERS